MEKKNKLSFVLVFFISVGLLGACDSVETSTIQQKTPVIEAESETPEVQSSPETAPIQAEKEMPPLLIEEIELVGFEILPPDSIGTIYMETQFKNNSDKIITGINYTYRVGDENSYLMSYDTLLPGETSVITQGFGPITGLPEDVQLLYVEITVENEDGTQTYLDYDTKLGKYEWF